MKLREFKEATTGLSPGDEIEVSFVPVTRLHRCVGAFIETRPNGYLTIKQRMRHHPGYRGIYYTKIRSIRRYPYHEESGLKREEFDRIAATIQPGDRVVLEYRTVKDNWYTMKGEVATVGGGRISLTGGRSHSYRHLRRLEKTGGH